MSFQYTFHQLFLQSPPAASSAQFFSPGNQFDCILHLETELANRNDLICELQERKDAQLQQLQVMKDHFLILWQFEVYPLTWSGRI